MRVRKGQIVTLPKSLLSGNNPSQYKILKVTEYSVTWTWMNPGYGDDPVTWKGNPSDWFKTNGYSKISYAHNYHAYEV